MVPSRHHQVELPTEFTWPRFDVDVVLESFAAVTLPPPVSSARYHGRPPRFLPCSTPPVHDRQEYRTRFGPTRSVGGTRWRVRLSTFIIIECSAPLSIAFAARPDSWHDVHGFSQPPTTIHERDFRRTHRRQSKTSTAARRRSLDRRTTSPPPPTFA